MQLDSRLVRTCENPIAWFVVRSFQSPSPKHVCNFGIHGNRLARNFRLAVGGRVCEQQYPAERVLPDSRVRLQHTESPSKKTTFEEKAEANLLGRCVGGRG